MKVWKKKICRRSQEAGYSLDELAEVAEQMVTGQLATVHSGDEEIENDVATWEKASGITGGHS